MKILIACEESQAVCKAFRALGHEAYSADIQPCSGGHPDWHMHPRALRLPLPWNPNSTPSASRAYLTTGGRTWNTLSYTRGRSS